MAKPVAAGAMIAHSLKAAGSGCATVSGAMLSDDFRLLSVGMNWF